MKLSLDSIAGIRKDSPPAADLFTEWQSTITQGWQADHLPDGTHRYVRERNRNVPLGEWTSVQFAPTMFSANNASTWTVGTAAFKYVGYTLVGKIMTVRFYIESSTVAVAAPSQLFMLIPDNYRAKITMFGTMLYDDNGTLGTGMVYTPTAFAGAATALNNRILAFATDLRASVNWTLSIALSLAGSFSFEIE